MFQITVSVMLRDVKMGLVALVKWPVFDYQFCLVRYVKQRLGLSSCPSERNDWADRL